MQNTDHNSKTKDSPQRTAALIFTIFVILILLFLFWYFTTYEVVPEYEGEKFPEHIDTELEGGAGVIVDKVRHTEELCMQSLRDCGFKTNQQIDGWYDIDDEGKTHYYAKTKFGNYSISTDDPDSGEYDVVPQERYLIGNVDVRDPETLEIHKFINQAAINCKMYYIAKCSDTECIYTDVYNNQAYKTTYYLEEHYYKTEPLTGEEAAKYAYK